MAKAKTVQMQDKRGNIANPLASDVEIWKAAGWSYVNPVKARAAAGDDQAALKPVITED